MVQVHIPDLSPMYILIWPQLINMLHLLSNIPYPYRNMFLLEWSTSHALYFGFT